MFPFYFCSCFSFILLFRVNIVRLGQADYRVEEGDTVSTWSTVVYDSILIFLHATKIISWLKNYYFGVFLQFCFRKNILCVTPHKIQ